MEEKVRVYNVISEKETDALKERVVQGGGIIMNDCRWPSMRMLSDIC